MPPFLVIALASFVTFGVYAVQWAARGESIIGMFRLPLGVIAVAVLLPGGMRVHYWLSVYEIGPVEASMINHIWPILVSAYAVVAAGTALGGRHVLGLVLGGIAVVLVGSGL